MNRRVTGRPRLFVVGEGYNNNFTEVNRFDEYESVLVRPKIACRSARHNIADGGYRESGSDHPRPGAGTGAMPVTAQMGKPALSAINGSNSDVVEHLDNRGSDRRCSSRIIQEIYQASIDPKHWDRVVTMIAKLTRSQSTCLYYKNREQKNAGSVAHYGLSKSAYTRFNWQSDTLDGMFCSSEISNAEETVCRQFYPGSNGFLAVDSSLYRDWMKPNGLYHVGGAQLVDNATHKAGIAMLRDEKSGAWNDGDLRLVDAILPHLRRALKIHFKFAGLRHRQDALLTRLDRHTIGLILYDHAARPVYINPTARTIIAGHPAMRLQDGELILDNVDDDRMLQKVLVQTGRIDPDDSWNQSIAIGITHPDIDGSLPLLITPMHANLITVDLEYDGAKVALFLGDSNPHQPISSDNLISAYRITPSEAQVAISLANGSSIDEIAEDSNHSVHTIRTQLKSIYRKTRVSRQSDLIKLLLTGPFAIQQIIKLQLKNSAKPRAT